MGTFRCHRLHHVNIVVDDLDAARDFYCAGLGLAVLPRPEFGFPGLWLGTGDGEVHLVVGDERPPLGQHFALQVDDLDAAMAHLAALGHDARRVTAIDGAGNQAFLRDPAGNLVELNQPA